MAARAVIASAAVVAVGWLACLTQQAQASPTALRVLIAYSDGAHDEHNIRDLLAAEPGVAAVDTVNAGATTPTLATLETYDVVVTYSNTDFADSTTLGSRLADFADAGGIVVEFDFDWTSASAARQLAGRWATGGYSPYTVGAATVTSSPPVTLGTHDASSPLLSGIPAFSTDYRMNTTPAAGAVEVAKWSDGSTGIAFKGRAVGVNTCVADGCSGAREGFARLIVNAARMRAVGQLFATDQGCAPDTFFQTVVAAGNSYAAPLAGVLTNWYFQSADPVLSGLKLKVGRDLGLAGFRVIGDSPAGTQAPNQANGPFPARVPVAAGDVIGLFTTGTGFCAHTGVSGDHYVFQPGDISPGTTTGVSAGMGSKFAVEALVEPDGDGDGFGDMTQDKCLGDSGSREGCRRADLAITKRASAGSVELGGPVTYTVTARNNGPDAAPGVTVTDTLPSGATLMSSSPGTCTGTPIVTCNVGTLASGASATIELVVTMTAAGSKTDVATVRSQALANAARAASGAGDPNAANDSASATTIVGLGEVAPAEVSGASQTRRRWREPPNTKLAQISRRRAPVGTTFRFTLDKPAAVALRFTQRIAGRKVSGRCVRPTRGNAKRPRCRRAVTRGTLRLQGHAGVNSVRFFGSISRSRKLRPGRYTLVIVASTPGAGNTSARLGFTIVR